MGKRKSGAELRFWLSARVDCKELRFIQCGNSLLLSDQFNALKPGARYMYLCMAMESGGRREFIFPLSSAKKYGISPSGLRRYSAELSTAGYLSFISRKSLRAPNVYRFDFAWESLATQERLAIYSKSGSA